MLARAMILLVVTNLHALAQPRDSGADALAGHAAEARQWAGEKDPLRRALFLDPVEIETPRTGLDCGHRPQASTGQGFVVLIETLETTPRRIRFFAPPGTLDSLPAARVAAMAFARAHAPGVELHQIAARAFSWCG